jgi:hypothetical protein
MHKAKDTLPAISAGAVFDFPYPFVKLVPSDSEWTWKPGCRMEDYLDEQYATADAMGSQIITVIGTYKPGRFPKRVFYTRKWRDPNGTEFGKPKCRVISISAFRGIIGGYRHHFDMAGQPRTPMPHLYRTSMADICDMMERAIAIEATR